MRLHFPNHIFLITGAASGMGRELAVQAAAAGADVLAVDINRIELEATTQLAKAAGNAISNAVLDVGNAAAIEAFAADRLPQLNGRRLVLINNAGMALAGTPFNDLRLADFERVIGVNLWGAIRLTKAFLPYLLQQREGHIVNTSSVFGFIGVMHNTAYCTSKFALRGFTESLRMELRGTGVTTTTVHPGGIRTNIVRNALVNTDLVPAAQHQQSITSFDRQARTTAESASRQILRAVVRKQERLVIGADGVLIDWLARLFPVAYTSLVERRLRKTFGMEE